MSRHDFPPAFPTNILGLGKCPNEGKTADPGLGPDQEGRMAAGKPRDDFSLPFPLAVLDSGRARRDETAAVPGLGRCPEALSGR